MPERQVRRRARRDQAEGKAPTTQAGEFVGEEMRHVREGKHGARSPRQAIAIGLSKARRAGVELTPPRPGATSEATRRSAERAYERGHGAPPARRPSAARKRAVRAALRREDPAAASVEALAKQARTSAGRRGAPQRAKAAQKAVGTKGPAKRVAAARKAARTRAQRAAR